MGKFTPDLRQTSKVAPLTWPPLPHLTHDRARRDACAMAPRRPMMVTLAAQTFEVVLNGDPPIPSGPDAVWVWCECVVGPFAVDLWLTPGLLERVLAAHGFTLTEADLFDPADLSGARAAMVAEYGLAPLFDPLAAGDATGAEIGAEAEAAGLFRVLACLPTADAPPDAAFPLTLRGADGSLAGGLVDAPAAPLLAILDRLTAPYALPAARMDPRLPVCLTGFEMALPATDWAACVPGDALLLPCDWPQGAGLVCSIDGSRLRADVTHANGVLTLATNFSPSERTAAMPPLSTLRHPLADMPVTISIELARVVVPLSELESMVTGSVLPITAQMPREVRLMMAEVCVGHGELVQVEGAIALRLTKLS